MSAEAAPAIEAAQRPRGLLSTILISAVLGAFAGFLWIGRGRVALVYLVAATALALLAFWRLYEGDGWTGWLAPLVADDLVGTVVSAAVSLALVLPLRKGSLPNRWYSRGWGVALAIVAAVLVSATLALAVRSFVLQPFSIPAGSMRPTLIEGDYVFASKRAYGYGPYSLPLGPWDFLQGERIPPKRGDIAIFRSPADPSFDYVKRVIGLPGDRIRVTSGVLSINGTPVRAEPVAPPAQSGGLDEPNATFQREFLPEGGSYIVQSLVDNGMGDNTAEFVVPPSHYFMMGDNRDNSSDSRFDLGMVPVENLVGRVDVIFWNSEGVEYRSRRILEPASAQ